MQFVSTVAINVAKFGDLLDAASPVAQPTDEDHEVENACNITPDLRRAELAKVSADEELEPSEGIRAAARMNGRG